MQISTALVLLLVLVGATDAATLDGLKKKCEVAKKTIEAAHKTAEQNAVVAYGKTLDAYRSHFKKHGNIDSYTPVDDEMVRFEASKIVLASKDITNPHINKAALAYEQAIKKAKENADAAHLKLLKRYTPALDRLIKQLMQADNIAEAKGAKVELDRVQFVLADLESSGTVQAAPLGTTPKRKTMKTSLSLPGFVGRNWVKSAIRLKKGDRITVDVTVHKTGARVWAGFGRSYDNMNVGHWLRLGEQELVCPVDGFIFFQTNAKQPKKKRGFKVVSIKMEVERVPLVAADLEAKQPKIVGKKAIPADAKEYNGHHYKIFASDRISWSNAKTKCEEMGGHLATLDSEEELGFVRGYKRKTVLWIGSTPGKAIQDDGKIHRRIDSGYRKNAGSKYINYYICEWDY